MPIIQGVTPATGIGFLMLFFGRKHDKHGVWPGSMTVSWPLNPSTPAWINGLFCYTHALLRIWRVSKLSMQSRMMCAFSMSV